MKKRNLFLTLGLALTLGTGVAGGLSLNRGEAKEVGAVSYSVLVDIKYAKNEYDQEWTASNAKLALYFFNNETNGWSSLVQMTAGTYEYTISGSIGFTPTKMIAVRMDPAATTGNWDQDWNQTANLNYGDVAIVADNLGVKYPVTEGLASNITLNQYHRNDSNNPEFYKQNVELTENATFKIAYNNSKYASLSDGVDPTYFSISSGNIKCNLDGNYDLYFDASNQKLWAQVDADTEATGFATTFLSTTNGICKDSSKGAGDTVLADLINVWNVKEPADDTSLVEKWNSLTSGAKSSFRTGTANKTIEDAHDRYIHIMSRYSASLTAFANGPVMSLNISEARTQNNDIMPIMIIASFITLALVGSFFVIRRRKEQE